jgi:predicted nucleic acid-binding protein
LIVVDTNIIAYFFIEGDRTTAARLLWEQEQQWGVPRLWRHEYLNVLATYTRAGGASTADVLQLWQTTEEMLTDLEYDVDMEAALNLAITNKISAYDAQFVTLAQTQNTRLVTEDRKLQKCFPSLVISLHDATGHLECPL